MEFEAVTLANQQIIQPYLYRYGAGSCQHSFASMLKIQSDVLNANKNLGNTTSQDSENALLKQTEANLLDLVTNKSELADSELGQYQDDVSQFAAYAHTLYQNPDKFIGVETDPPDKTNKDQLIMGFCGFSTGFSNRKTAVSRIGTECQETA